MSHAKPKKQYFILRTNELDSTPPLPGHNINVVNNLGSAYYAQPPLGSTPLG